MKFIFIWCFSLTVCYSQVPLNQWEIDTDKDDVQISYRKILVGDSLKTRQMKVDFEIVAGSNDVLRSFFLAEEFQKWSANAEKCDIVNLYDNNHWELYCLYDAPWPFKERDMQTDYSLDETEENLIIKARPVQHEIIRKDGVVRMSQYIGEWIFFKRDNVITRCEFTSYTLTKPVVFTFIQDPIVQSFMIESVRNLKSLIGK